MERQPRAFGCGLAHGFATKFASSVEARLTKRGGTTSLDSSFLQEGLPADNVEAGWRAMQPVLDVWSSVPPKDFPNYVVGGTGPAAADELLARDGHTWRPLP
jgi:Glucose-6-phosphate dehydrogenase, C-terminal domain